MSPTVDRRSSTTALLSLAVLAACAEEPFAPVPQLVEPPPAMVSDPVSFTAAAPAAAPGVDVVYVSLPPGSLPSGSEVEVRNVANEAEERIPVTGGGFDPVPIPAQPGDTLRFRVYAGSLGDDLESPIILAQWDETVPAASPPDIVRTYPRGGKRDVPVALSILVVFSEPLDSLSLGAGSVELLVGGAPVPATLNLSPDGLRVALAPAAPLAASTDYVLRIVDSIEDLDGDLFGREELIRFTTGTPGSQAVLAPTDLCTDHPPTSIPTFVDANLEGAVRTALGFTAQDILTCEVVADLTSLSHSPALYQTLPPPATSIQSVVGIQNLTGLTRLVLANHALADIGPLSRLTNLDTLSLTVANNTPPTLSDIAPLAALTGLQYLNLNNTIGIDDLSPLRGLSSLAELYIRYNSISDLGPLSGLASLRRLNLAGNAIEDVSPLAVLTGLTWMAVNENAITDIGPLSGLTRVSGTLWLYGNQITDLRAVRGMTGIQRLYASGNNITNLRGLENLTSMSQLVLDDNPNLSDVAGLLANPTLAGDTIALRNTSVSCADVQRLEDRGALVYHSCGIPPVVLAARSLTPATVGESYVEVLMATGGTGVYTWSSFGPLPAGLSLSASGVISGVPTVAGSASVPVTVHSGGVLTSRTFPIVISSP